MSSTLPSAPGSERPEELRLFVGRETELKAWQAALESATPTVVHVTGPAGIGKSALLRVFAEQAKAAALAVKELDARTLQPSIPDIRAGLDAVGLTGATARAAFLIDTYEELTACDFFVRAEVLRRIGPHVVVIAGRGQPDASWFANNGWGARIVHLQLKSLDAAATSRYLDLRGLGGARGQAVRAFCQGYPLALALAVEAELQPGAAPLQPGSDPDIVGALFERFVRELPDEASRSALEVCALTRNLREDLLADFVGAETAARVFPWLRRLSFVERGPRGVRLHELARSVTLRDLQWRNPSRFEELFARGLAVLADRAQRSGVGDATQIVEDIQSFMRLVPELRGQVEPTATEQLAFDIATAEDAPLIEKILRMHEGEVSVGTFRRWFASGRGQLLVVRSPADPVLGFAGTIWLDARAANDPDPRIRAVWQHASRLLGPKGGRVSYVPFWMTREGYQRIDQARLALAQGMARNLFEPEPVSLAYSHSTSTEADVAGFERTGARIVRELGFQQNGVDQIVALYDLRGLTPQQWYVRSLRAMGAPSNAAPSTAERLTLDRERFDTEVRACLRSLHDSSQLKQSPLIDARFVGEGSDGRSARATRLRAALVQQIESLRGGLQGDRQHRAVRTAFVESAESQELAAERLGMAYSTFRRYLAAGVKRVVDGLWSREIGEDV